MEKHGTDPILRLFSVKEYILFFLIYFLFNLRNKWFDCSFVVLWITWRIHIVLLWRLCVKDSTAFYLLWKTEIQDFIFYGLLFLLFGEGEIFFHGEMCLCLLCGTGENGILNLGFVCAFDKNCRKFLYLSKQKQ